jgi:hypothetical protein
MRVDRRRFLVLVGSLASVASVSACQWLEGSPPTRGPSFAPLPDPVGPLGQRTAPAPVIVAYGGSTPAAATPVATATSTSTSTPTSTPTSTAASIPIPTATATLERASQSCADLGCLRGPVDEEVAELVTQCNNLERVLHPRRFDQFMTCIKASTAPSLPVARHVRKCEVGVSYTQAREAFCLALPGNVVRVDPATEAPCRAIVARCGERSLKGLSLASCQDVLTGTRPTSRASVGTCIAESCSLADAPLCYAMAE